jgi:hypothetical protein
MNAETTPMTKAGGILALGSLFFREVTQSKKTNKYGLLNS